MFDDGLNHDVGQLTDRGSAGDVERELADQILHGSVGEQGVHHSLGHLTGRGVQAGVAQRSADKGGDDIARDCADRFLHGGFTEDRTQRIGGDGVERGHDSRGGLQRRQCTLQRIAQRRTGQHRSSDLARGIRQCRSDTGSSEEPGHNRARQVSQPA